jgi:hypothetical protein
MHGGMEHIHRLAQLLQNCTTHEAKRPVGSWVTKNYHILRLISYFVKE